MQILFANSKLFPYSPNCLRLLLIHKMSVWVGLDKLIPPLIRQNFFGVFMKINTDKIEHILRTKYGWDRFPLNEDVKKVYEEKKPEKNKTNKDSINRFHC